MIILDSCYYYYICLNNFLLDKFVGPILGSKLLYHQCHHNSLYLVLDTDVEVVFDHLK